MPSTVRGTELNRYRIIRLLGRGGMGEVYLARDETLQRQVAVKFLSLDSTDSARVSVLREARTIAALEHPHICGVYEVGEAEDGRPFIVMPYVEGVTLAQMIAAGTLTPVHALEVCAQVADALSAAHRKGLVHRDLKPQNIIVTPSGSAKLLDFGLAKALPMAPFATDTNTQSTGSTTGAVKGTPAYMSPEQVLGQPVDARSDLFALGAVLYESLTGRRAFEGSGFQLVGQILHAHPADPSTLRAGLSPRHDALCRRLLAKDPAARFQSAEELLAELRGFTGVAVAAPPSGSTPAPIGLAVSRPGRRRRAAALVAALALCAAAALAIVWPSRTGGLPAPPPDAQRWYARGVEAIHQGAYHSGQLALLEAVRIAPAFALAHARLAEARAELDDERGAQEALLRVSSIVPDESALPGDELLRLKGIRALVLRDVDASVASYRALAERRPSDAACWLDLGRAQESAGRVREATDSYRRALQADTQLPAAHLRLGWSLAQQLKGDDALAALDEAVRLYAAAANVEGEAEAVLRRGMARDTLGDTAKARTDVERALALASTLRATQLSVRARLALSGVEASEGRVSESIRLAGDAVQEALAAGLDTVAADGLINLAASLQYEHAADAASECERAMDLAGRRGAQRTLARARVQLASARLEQGRPADALPLLDQALAFLRPHHYRQLELSALAVAARTHERLGDFVKARGLNAEVLSEAEPLRDEVPAGIALGNLASLSTALGELPEALAYRVRAEAFQRKNDAAALPYHVANRADLLIRLGRPHEASAPLAEIEEGAARGLDSYKGRLRRVVFLRGMADVIAMRFREAVARLEPLAPFTGEPGALGAVGPSLLAYARVRSGLAAPATPAVSPAAPDAVDPVSSREALYWRARVAMVQRDWRTVADDARHGLDELGASGNDELRWRLSATAAIAARELGRTQESEELTASAKTAVAALRARWQGEAESYFARPDLAELLTQATLTKEGDSR